MAQRITAQFATRRDAEMAVERLVQEHGIDRNAIEITAASDANTAGTEPAGADVEGGREKTDTEGEPALRGEVKVSATIDDAQADAALASFESCGATNVSR